MKIILDTNVLIDAINDDFSHTWKIIDLVLSGNLQAYASEKIIKEYHLIISRNVVREDDKQRLEKFIAQTEIVSVSHNQNFGALIPDDPEDEKFLLAAENAQADYIISSDAHLLRLEKYKNTQILTPKDFYFTYQGQRENEENTWQDPFRHMLGI